MGRVETSLEFGRLENKLVDMGREVIGGFLLLVAQGVKATKEETVAQWVFVKRVRLIKLNEVRIF